jgi:hypothetical protein
VVGPRILRRKLAQRLEVLADGRKIVPGKRPGPRGARSKGLQVFERLPAKREQGRQRLSAGKTCLLEQACAGFDHRQCEGSGETAGAVINRFVPRLDSHRHSSQAVRNAPRHAHGAGMTLECEDHAIQVRLASRAERLQRMHRSRVCPEPRERRKGLRRQRAAGVQHHSATPLLPADSPQLRRGGGQRVVRSGQQDNVRSQHGPRRHGVRDAPTDRTNGRSRRSAVPGDHRANGPAGIAQTRAQHAPHAPGANNRKRLLQRAILIASRRVFTSLCLLNFAWHHLLTAVLGLIALFWVVTALRTGAGILRLPRLAAVRPLSDTELPSVAVLFSARDEAEKMPAALRSMLAQDYPRYQVVAVDDRSSDATPQILDEFARACKHLIPVRVDALPPGWLGKPYGLQQAYEHSSGEWLVFTDADVVYEPDVLRRAVSLAIEKGWDHLTLLAAMEMVGFWEKTLVTFFALAGILYARPWDVPNPRSRCYAGVGAFQLLRRSVYESIGAHTRLAMEVVDDMKLAKLVKEAGYISGVAWPARSLHVRWHAGLRNVIRGTEKNFFAASGFSLGIVTAVILATLLLFVTPCLALLFTTGLAQVLAGVAVAAELSIHAGFAMAARVSLLYALTHPLGALIIVFMLARSTFLTLRQGGIYWRGTFYPLEQLRRGLV